MCSMFAKGYRSEMHFYFQFIFRQKNVCKVEPIIGCVWKNVLWNYLQKNCSTLVHQYETLLLRICTRNFVIDTLSIICSSEFEFQKDVRLTNYFMQIKTQTSFWRLKKDEKFSTFLRWNNFLANERSDLTDWEKGVMQLCMHFWLHS